ncbi:MAG: TraM recognition domain-containing protein [Paludisphaera borealis]|uniref:TraM recognition domain-containing protein n=1 Tax=Paludisphaera borealis TaxID=1387353 RepID=UPI00283D18CC|nr:TraM recognition domain-containing protein [Paludisphaera borealis]MDR3620476.1 TraM recognition domain-containing protein [Paludisphaera borealis]
MATGKCPISSIYNVLVSAPLTKADLNSDAWQAHSFCAYCLREGEARAGSDRDFILCRNFFVHEWIATAERQRTTGLSMITNICDKFLTGQIADMLCGETTVSPRDILDRGAVIACDTPILTYGAVGRYCNVAWKILTQRAALMRDASTYLRPACIWADEAQLFTSEADARVQAVSRKYKLINISLTQSIPLLKGEMGGGPKADQQALAWLGNHSTKIFCGNSDMDTNRYCSALCGSEWVDVQGGSMPSRQGEYDLVEDALGRPTGNIPSISWNSQRLPTLQPEDFTRLRREDGHVQTVIFRNGLVFPDGRTWAERWFDQNQ